MKSNLAQQQSNDNSDFLIGDVVVLVAPVTFVNRVFDTNDLLFVECVTANGGVGIALHEAQAMYVDSTEIRHATTIELDAKRRLTPAEQALGDVS